MTSHTPPTTPIRFTLDSETLPRKSAAAAIYSHHETFTTPRGDTALRLWFDLHELQAVQAVQVRDGEVLKSGEPFGRACLQIGTTYRAGNNLARLLRALDCPGDADTLARFSLDWLRAVPLRVNLAPTACPITGDSAFGITGYSPLSGSHARPWDVVMPEPESTLTARMERALSRRGGGDYRYKAA